MESAIQEIEWLARDVENEIKRTLEDINRSLESMSREQERLTKLQGLYKNGIERLASLKKAIKVLETKV